MIVRSKPGQAGFSLLELMIAMTITLILMSIITMLFSRAMGVRARESRKTDALTSSQAALNVMSREIANSGFGLYSDPVTRVPNNGIVLADSNSSRIRIRANLNNSRDYSGPASTGTSNPGDDVMYFLDPTTASIVRYDQNAVAPDPTASVVVNRISNVTFQYVNYTYGSSATTTTSTPTANTGRVIITIVVQLEPVQGQPNPGTVTFTSDVTLRNANYMLQQY